MKGLTIPNTNEMYFIDKDGNVFSLYSNKYLKPQKLSIGYLVVALKTINGIKRKYIHRLIAELYIPNTENKPCVNHKNSVRSDNAINNLEWCTHKENYDHAKNAGRITIIKGRDHYAFGKEAYNKGTGKLIKYNCKTCSKDFSSRHLNRKYCSRKCYYKSKTLTT